jgi:cytochrome c6
MRAAFALPVLAVALAAAGCGGGNTVQPTAETVVGPVPTHATPTTTATKHTGSATAGKQVFASAGCTSCHTLKNAGSTGTVGPNLDQAQPPYDRVVDRVTNGRGAMPSFKGQLSPQQIQNVAAYVSSVAGQ